MGVKYNNKKINYDGYVFDSTIEYKRYIYLKDKENNGYITDLSVHPKYILLEGKEGIRNITYTADFKYTNTTTDIEVVEDVKGIKTDVYKLKKKMMKLLKNIDIKEVYKYNED